jgi:D-alanyl-D-alanine carboxypeptidase
MGMLGSWSRRTALAVVLGGIAVASGSIPAGAAAQGGHSDFPAAKLAALRETIQTSMTDQRVPGVNVGVFAPGGRRWIESFGVADISTDEPMDVPDNVRIASISKTFTGIAVLRLVDRGRLGLNDTVDEFVDGIPNGHHITIRQLLGMTGGIYDFTRDEEFAADFAANPLLPWTPQDVLDILARHDPDFPPGYMVSYSDSNYILLGLIIGQLTGRPANVIIDRLSRRAGLTHTLFPTEPEIAAPFAHGYYGGDEDDQPLADYTLVNPDVPWTAGAMTSTLHDLKRWAKLLGEGRLISKRLFAKQTRFNPISNPGGPSVGYGLGIFKFEDWIGHNGAIYGFNTSMFYLPAERATIVVSANKSTNFSSETIPMFFEIAKTLFPGSV